MKTLRLDGNNPNDIALAGDILRRGGVDVTVAALKGNGATGAHNIYVQADATLENVKENPFDMLILPGGGGGTENLKASETVLELVRKYDKEGKFIAAICAAPTVLAKAGIVDHHLITSSPGTEGAFKPEQHKPVPVIVSANITTGRAPGTAIDFALELLHTLEGEERMEKIKSDLVYQV